MSTRDGQSPSGSTWHRWVNAPQKVGLRRALFQIHLWIGIALGIYIVMISITGSAVVFRRELNLWLVPRTVTATAGVSFTRDQLEAAARRTYPQQEVKTVTEPRRADRPVRVTLERNGQVTERLFDPYAGKDLGLEFPPLLRAEEWLVELHDDLLSGLTGRFVNGLAGILTTVLAISGAVIWWPGRHRWRESLVVNAPLKSRKFLWQLHSSVGLWAFALLFVWSITAVYFAFPEPVEAAFDVAEPLLHLLAELPHLILESLLGAREQKLGVLLLVLEPTLGLLEGDPESLLHLAVQLVHLHFQLVHLNFKLVHLHFQPINLPGQPT